MTAAERGPYLQETHTMTTKTARSSTIARTARAANKAAIAPIAAAYVAAHEALLAAIARIDKLDDAGVPASSPAARTAVAAWDAAYEALDRARTAYEWACDARGLSNPDFDQDQYELELYSPWDWDMPEAYVRLSRA